MFKLNVVYDTTSGKRINNARLRLQQVEIIQELEALLQNIKQTLNILSNGFQLCTLLHDWRTRYCILV